MYIQTQARMLSTQAGPRLHLLEVVEARKAPIDWRRGDRIIVKWEDDVYYVGTVTKIGSKYLEIRYDDGEDGRVTPRSRSILGRADSPRKRAKAMTEKKARKMLEDPGGGSSTHRRHSSCQGRQAGEAGQDG